MNDTNVRVGFSTLVVAVCVSVATATAGDLEPPPGTLAPTMVTLDEIFDKPVVSVIEANQNECWDMGGNLIPCAGTGQDGETQAGVWVNPRFTDRGDGTARDNLTGLIWLKHVGCMGTMNWITALNTANGLADGDCSLTDGSVAGDWRLPNIRELQTLVDFGETSPAIPNGDPFIGQTLEDFWSSSSSVEVNSWAWVVDFAVGSVQLKNKTAGDRVWPVRSEK